MVLIGGCSASSVVLHVPLESDTLQPDGTDCRNGMIYLAEYDIHRRSAGGKTKAFASHNPDKAGKAFDADAESYWSPAPHAKENTFLGLDMGEARTIYAVEWDGHTYGEGFPESFELLTSMTDADHRGPVAAPDRYRRITNLTLSGASGRKRNETDGVVEKNMESHGVRLTFPARKARQICLRIHRPHLPIQFPRITRFSVLAPPENTRGTITATLSPDEVRQWEKVTVNGTGIVKTECRWRSEDRANWSAWHEITGDFPDSMNYPPSPEAQIRVTLSNRHLPSHKAAVLKRLNVVIQGTAVGPPELRIPPKESELANPSPTFLWRPDANAGFLHKIRYELQVSSDANFSAQHTKTISATSTDVATISVLPKPSKAGRYFWRVRCAPGQKGVDDRYSPAGSFTLGDTPNPPSNDSPFGIGMGLTEKPWGVELAKEAGFRWSRGDFAWYRVNPEKDVWDWTLYDKYIEMAKKVDVAILGALGCTPAWVSPEGEASIRHIRPADLRAWIRYVYETAHRYRNDVAAWEVCNEHNHRGFFSGTPRDIAELLKSAYITIKNINPDALVTFGGHAGFSPLYLDEVAKYIGHAYWDVLNWHCYPGWPDEIYYRDWVDLVLRYQRKLGLHKPIWLTEIGTPRKPGISEDEIAARMVAYYVSNMQTWPGKPPNRIDKTFYFQFCESHGFGVPQMWAMIVDYKDPNTLPDKLPVFHAFRTLTKQLGGATWCSREETAGLIVHNFASSDSTFPSIQVIWADPESGQALVYLRSTGQARVLTMYGKRIAEGSKRFSRPLQIPRRPFYVISTQPCIFTKAEKTKIRSAKKGKIRESYMRRDGCRRAR